MSNISDKFENLSDRAMAAAVDAYRNALINGAPNYLRLDTENDEQWQQRLEELSFLLKTPMKRTALFVSMDYGAGENLTRQLDTCLSKESDGVRTPFVSVRISEHLDKDEVLRHLDDIATWIKRDGLPALSVVDEAISDVIASQIFDDDIPF